jgi:hypothetical protein
VETISVGGELNIDLAPDGTVYGIELLNASEQARAGDGGRIVVVDEAAGEARALVLPPAPGRNRPEPLRATQPRHHFRT